MIATAHALMGGAIAAGVSNPALGLTLSAISHPLADMIPHWDFAQNWRQKSKVIFFLEASFDLLFGVLITYLIFSQYVDFKYLMACIFLTEVWDILESPYWFLKWKFPPFSWIYEVQHRMQNKATFFPGVLTQIAAVAVVVSIFGLFR